jgi:aminopeptidase N
VRRLAAAFALLAIVAAGCDAGSSAAPPAPSVPGRAGDTGTTAYDAAVSRPREDSVYPDVGDPGVDALHYDLDLAWDPRAENLTGRETVLLRATTTSDHLRLDLARQLTVDHVWLDGRPVSFQHPGKDLVVAARVEAGSRHLLQLTYAGLPEPVRAPTDRLDFSTTGWTIAPGGTVWTMQEPYGAYSWYAVNDQPSDKAYYDATIRAPEGRVGVFNGELRSRTTSRGVTTTRWHLPEPAASYLITIAIGRFTETRDTGPHGLPITYWTPTGQPHVLRQVRYAPRAVRYLEGLVGRYPFPTLGVLVVPSNSAMETQSMVTLGSRTGYPVSRDVIVHEIAHQWYGDTVTPDDWSDVWMSEGMATYLAEANWTADHEAQRLDTILRRWAELAGAVRSRYGAPTRYLTGSFAEGDVYYIPALMWDTLRRRLGDERFWSLARRWVTSHRFTSRDRGTLAAWWSRQAGQDLGPFFSAWLSGPDEPVWRAVRSEQ